MSQREHSMHIFEQFIKESSLMVRTSGDLIGCVRVETWPHSPACHGWAIGGMWPEPRHWHRGLLEFSSHC